MDNTKRMKLFEFWHTFTPGQKREASLRAQKEKTSLTTQVRKIMKEKGIEEIKDE